MGRGCRGKSWRWQFAPGGRGTIQQSASASSAWASISPPARLGSVTTVWTTREDDLEWTGLRIDFDALRGQRHFRTPELTRPKIDPKEHGTEISVEKLKPEQRQWFAKPANRSNLKKELSRAYSAMLRPGGVPTTFRLLLNGSAVQGRQHCVWGGEGNPAREVSTQKFGPVSAYQPIDVQLPARPFCKKCWQWLPAEETVCPSCLASTDVVARRRSIRGWIGIQRYLSETEYGIDVVRHGRKIEIANKDLFQWQDAERIEPEYPIDDPRQRGRIVGEIHLDHCRVTYTKDRFDRTDPAWEDMVRVVRGEGPLRPDKAAGAGFGPNYSPLFKLFQLFRRSTPKPKVALCYARLLIVPDNDRAEEMVKKFHEGDPAYQTDAKWWELVEEADRQLLLSLGTGPGATGGSTPGPGDTLDGFGPAPTNGGAPAPSRPLRPYHQCRKRLWRASVASTGVIRRINDGTFGPMRCSTTIRPLPGPASLGAFEPDRPGLMNSSSTRGILSSLPQQ